MVPRYVIPAQAGFHTRCHADPASTVAAMESRLRGDDEWFDTLETEA